MKSIYVPFTKVEAQDDGTCIVSGKVTDAVTDIEGQRPEMGWFKGAVTDWFNTAANVREMHQLSAVGKGIELDFDADGSPWVRSKIVDPVAAVKCIEGVYTGYSYGLKRQQIVRDPAGLAPNGLIKGGLMIELSIVDRGANPRALLSLDKVAGHDDEPDEDDIIDDPSPIEPDLTKGEPDPGSMAQAVMQQAFELEDSQLFALAAQLVRYAMLRQLHEAGSPDAFNMSFVIGTLANIYDTLLSFSSTENDDAWQAMVNQIIPALGTNHDIAEATSVIMGKAAKTPPKGKALAAMRAVHDTLKTLAPDICKAADEEGGEMEKAAIADIVREVLAEEGSTLIKAMIPEAPDHTEELARLSEQMVKLESDVETIGTQAPSRAYGGPALPTPTMRKSAEGENTGDPMRAEMVKLARSTNPMLSDPAQEWLEGHPESS